MLSAVGRIGNIGSVGASRSFVLATGLNGDGVTDNAPIINALLAKNPRLLLPPPSVAYMIGSPLLIPSNGGLRGLAGMPATLQAKSNMGDVSIIRNKTNVPASAAARDRNLTFENLIIDGRKSLNSSGTEQSHGLLMLGVNGLRVNNVIVKNMKGDGLYMGSATGFPTILTSNASGSIRVEDCDRQGVTVTGAEDVSFNVVSYRSRYFGVDVEPNTNQISRRLYFNLQSNQDGTGTTASGGIGISDNGANTVLEDITVDLVVNGCNGSGVVYRSVNRLTVRGIITNATSNGISAISGGTRLSTNINLALVVNNPTGYGLACNDNQGGTIDGWIEVDSAGQMGVSLRNQTGGTLRVKATNGAQQGIGLVAVSGMTFPDCLITGNTGHGVWFRNASSNNTFLRLTSQNNTPFGWGVIEDSGCDYNALIGSVINGNAAGQIQLTGANSYTDAGEQLLFEGEPLLMNGDYLTMLV